MRVIPWLRGLGLGAQLLQAAERLATDHGFERLQLTVDKKNAAAQRFYARCGFKVTGQLVDHDSYTTRTGRTVRIRRPQFIMEKWLASPDGANGQSVASRGGQQSARLVRRARRAKTSMARRLRKGRQASRDPVKS
jgi:hypothetical protein